MLLWKICHEDLLWRFVMKICYEDLLWRFVMKICYEDLLWRFVMKICYEDLLWRYVMKICYEDFTSFLAPKPLWTSRPPRCWSPSLLYPTKLPTTRCKSSVKVKNRFYDLSNQTTYRKYVLRIIVWRLRWPYQLILDWSTCGSS